MWSPFLGKYTERQYHDYCASRLFIYEQQDCYQVTYKSIMQFLKDGKGEPVPYK